MGIAGYINTARGHWEQGRGDMRSAQQSSDSHVARKASDVLYERGTWELNAWKRSRAGVGAVGARHESTVGAHAVNEHGQGRRNTRSKRVGAWLAASGHMGTRRGPSMNKHSKEVRNVAHTGACAAVTWHPT